METPAQRSLAITGRWLARSSAQMTTPLGKPMSRGAYASIIGHRMNAPLAGTWDDECFVIAIDSEAGSGVHLAPPQNAPPVGQPPLWERIEHVAFLAGQGRELGPAVWIGLRDAAQTLGEALAASGVGTGLADRLPYFFVRLWTLPPNKRRELATFFPYVSSHPFPVECEIAQAARIPAKREPFRLYWR